MAQKAVIEIVAADLKGCVVAIANENIGPRNFLEERS